MNRVRYDNFYFPLIFFFSFVVILLLINFPDVVSSGISCGLSLCANTLIASMFPFFVLSSFLLRTGAVEYMGKFFDKFSRKVFKLSGNAFTIFFISIFSGFPVGAKLVSSMLDDKKISLSQSSRLMCCCINAGPAFVISAVGNSMLSNRKAGLIIFVSLSLSALLILYFSKYFVADDDEFLFSTPKRESLSSCFVRSVSDATESILAVCGFVIVFSSFSYALKDSARIITLFLEVSIGCEYATKNFDLPIVAGVIGWSGFCVHCQVFHSVIKCNMKKILFFLCRALHGALSAVFCALLVKAFPCPVSVFANSSENVQQLFKSNAPATAGLLLMCAILIFDFEESRNNKSQTFKSLKKVKILRK